MTGLSAVSPTIPIQQAVYNKNRFSTHRDYIPCWPFTTKQVQHKHRLYSLLAVYHKNRFSTHTIFPVGCLSQKQVQHTQTIFPVGCLSQKQVQHTQTTFPEGCLPQKQVQHTHTIFPASCLQQKQVQQTQTIFPAGCLPRKQVQHTHYISCWLFTTKTGSAHTLYSLLSVYHKTGSAHTDYIPCWLLITKTCSAHKRLYSPLIPVPTPGVSSLKAPRGHHDKLTTWPALWATVNARPSAGLQPLLQNNVRG